MPDGEFQYPLFHTVVMPLRHHFRNRPNARVNGNTFIYYEEGKPSQWVSPDCYVAFDVDVSLIEYHNTYRVWAIGKPPDFVMEIGSKSTARRDMTAKRDLYAKLGHWRILALRCHRRQRVLRRAIDRRTSGGWRV